MRRRVGAMLRPPPQLTVSEWAERHRMNALTLLEILRDLLLGAAAGLAGGFVRWNNPERRRFGWCLAWEVPSAALVGSAGYALGGFLEFNEYGRFLFAFVFGYLGQAALHDLAVAIIRHRTGLPPGDGTP